VLSLTGPLAPDATLLSYFHYAEAVKDSVKGL